ncbi:MAG TPA: tryptophan-rich sensory protein [Candidatus Avimonoglobus intestinipullorum]|uniref:Tryptophan-rich sensory protein n=1 Tax=Candidatus Avimonoglobus intestinipullorum TaxID=2840699 RepID=A0A9D1S5K4_9FIRM|nr:tryptophan-rich sensory protein [Candidatus Avimonoglobus intestinipullorum]
MNKKNIKALVIAILIPLAVGALSALLTKDSMQVYNQLNKPALSPPPVVFPIVWAILYILMGISSYMIHKSGAYNRASALKLYTVQLALNLAWPIIFFALQLYLAAFLWLLALIAVLGVMIYRFYRIRPLAAYLQLPYLAWTLFAAYLNWMVFLLN